MENNCLPLNQIVLGDCVKVLAVFPENSIDCIVTDPPYGMSFMGKEWDKALPPKEAFVQMYRVLKPGALAFVMSSPRQDLMWRMAQLLEDSGFGLQQSFINWIYSSGFPKGYDVSKGIDKKLGAERTEFKQINPFPDGGARKQFGVRDLNNNIYDRGDAGNLVDMKDGMLNVSLPATDEAKKWDGWRSVAGLKPAFEVIFMVQKPITESTIVENVLKWGTGAMNVDDCRIPFKDVEDEKESVDKNRHEDFNSNDGVRVPTIGIYGGDNRPPINYDSTKGRFPANVLVSDGALDDEYEKRTGTKNIKIGRSGSGKQGIYGDFGIINGANYNDSGFFSRFFSLDAWAKHFGFIKVPKASTSERDDGLSKKIEDDYSIEKQYSEDMLRLNKHPTVKPVKLGAYLCELGCPPKGIVLDPFCGSGSFMVAAKIMGKLYIGIELDSDYHGIAQERVLADLKLETKKIVKEVRPDKPMESVDEMFK